MDTVLLLIYMCEYMSVYPENAKCDNSTCVARYVYGDRVPDYQL